MAQPFARASALFSLIAAVASLPKSEQAAAFAGIGAYRSRGKGRGTPPRRFGNPSGRYSPHQGEREMARRRRQIAAGRIDAAQILTERSPNA